MERVSVIIPAYNIGGYLEEAINSALQQTYPVHEVIVVNDGSTDGTEAVLQRFATNPLVRSITTPNKGVAAARNRGIAAATGNFIAFLDGDDVWLSNKLTEQLPLFSSPATLAVYSDMELFGSQSGSYRAFNTATFYSGRILPQLIRKNFVPTSTVVVRSEALKQSGLFFEDPVRQAIAEDYDLWLRLAVHGEYAYSDKMLVRYRCHETQSSRSRSATYRAVAFLLGRLQRDPLFAEYQCLLILQRVRYMVRYYFARILCA